MILDEWLARAQALGASDLHLESDTPVLVRVRGELQVLGAGMSGAQLLQAAQDLLGPQGWAQLRERGSADVALAAGTRRCRASFFRTVRGIAAAIRLLTASVKDLRACNLHPDLRRLVQAPSGLAIVSGPTGSGKSTTLAALIEELNASQARHIVTLESPLEYLFTNRHCFIRQREIPAHSPSYEQGIVDALRENPDVLVIGEMRTPEVMRLTLAAAETGHLVLATMHSATCSEALGRLCLSFPAELQGSVRAQLADCLVGVCCQRLDFLPEWQLRVPRCELLLGSSGARGAIRAGNFSHLATVLQSGAEEGMWSFSRYQRWMQQIGDWQRPSEAPPTADWRRSGGREGSRDGQRTGAGAALGQGAGPAAGGPAPHPRAPRPDSTTPAPARPMGTGVSAGAAAGLPADVIEVPLEETDLTELEKLARRLVERKP
ncbi:MAG TPA: ATPase, T2SS/T4P/T4SS family [Steroidobacteraceae bacterium]|nr:ATPase, T2SS/T4P/T4SS family [Steroidobacteraceae bacterium]